MEDRPPAEGRPGTSQRRLARRFSFPPIVYQREHSVEDRFVFTVKRYGALIPPSFLQIMFGQGRGRLVRLYRQFQVNPSRSERQKTFRKFFDQGDDAIEGLRELLPEERIYLYELRDALNLFYGPTRHSAENFLKHKERELARASANIMLEHPRGPRVKCSNPRCSRKFPPQKTFFPTMREKSKSPGRCYICFSSRRTKTNRAARTKPFRIKRPVGRAIAGDQLELLSLCDVLEIPTVGISALFGVSSSQIEDKRTATISRNEGLRRYHHWMASQEPPSYAELTPEQNALLAQSWHQQRAKITGCNDASSYEARRQELLQYTEQRKQDPAVPLKRCVSCSNVFVRDEVCFHVLRIKGRKAAFVASCVACVNERRAGKYRRKN